MIYLLWTALLMGDLLLWVVHELGHLIAWRFMGVKHDRIVAHFNWKRPWRSGLGMSYKADRINLSRKQQIIGASGGLIGSLTFGLILLAFFPLLGFASIGFGLFLALPFIKNSDGNTIYNQIRRNKCS